MKRILSAILLFFLVLCAGIGFVGCHHDNKETDNNKITDSVTYYGILRKIDVSESLYVYIPEIGDCIFPTYEDPENKIVIKGGRVYDEPLKEGDLIGLNFSTKDIQFQETYPVRIATPVHVIYLYKENVQLEKDGEDYLLTMNCDEFSNMAFHYSNIKMEVGTTVTIWKAQFITGDGDGTGSSDCGSATIERISSEQVTLRLNLFDSIGKFLRNFAIGALAFDEN